MDRRLSAEEKRRKEEAARKAANVPLVGPVGDPFGSSGMSSSSAAPAFAVGSGFTGGNRAEKASAKDTTSVFRTCPRSSSVQQPSRTGKRYGYARIEYRKASLHFHTSKQRVSYQVHRMHRHKGTQQDVLQDHSFSHQGNALQNSIYWLRCYEIRELGNRTCKTL